MYPSLHCDRYKDYECIGASCCGDLKILGYRSRSRGTVSRWHVPLETKGPTNGANTGCSHPVPPRSPRHTLYTGFAAERKGVVRSRRKGRTDLCSMGCFGRKRREDDQEKTREPSPAADFTPHATLPDSPQCTCGNRLIPDDQFCRKCGAPSASNTDSAPVWREKAAPRSNPDAADPRRTGRIYSPSRPGVSPHVSLGFGELLTPLPSEYDFLSDRIALDTPAAERFA